FITVAYVNEIALYHRGGVDRAGAEDVAPDLLTGTDLEGVDAAVAAATDEQPLAGDLGDHGSRIISVLGRQTGLAPPADVAGALVKGHEAIGAAGVFAPAGVEHAHNHQVPIDDRTGDAAAVARDAAVLLGERMLPQDLAVFVEAEEEALHAVGVDV